MSKLIQRTVEYLVVRLPGYLSSSVLHSHARVDELPYAERSRKANRTPINFNSSDGLSRSQLPIVINSPTKYKKSWNRDDQNWTYRAQIPRCKSPRELLDCLQEAIESGHVDTSVIAVAMKRCGGSRWWDPLLQVRSMQKQAGIPTNTVLQSIFLSALAGCTRGAYGFGIVHGRTESILALGKEIWLEAEANLVSFTSALKLCVAVESPGGLAWADSLWTWAGTEGHQSNWMAFTVYLRALAACGQPDRVDRLLPALRSMQFEGDMNYLLGALVDVAGHHHNWERADRLWRIFVDEHRIQPNFMCYTAWAKAHLLCGRPHVAADKIDEMLKLGMSLDDKLTVDHAQCLLVTCHSTMTLADRDRLIAALTAGTPLLIESARTLRETWVKILSATRQLGSTMAPLCLHDVLVEWKSSTLSVMKDWEHYPAGCNYLQNSS